MFIILAELIKLCRVNIKPQRNNKTQVIKNVNVIYDSKYNLPKRPL